MPYIKTTWVNGSAPAINATNLNKIEDGIFDVTNSLATHSTVTATLTVLGHVYNGVYTATVLTSSWSGTTSPYTASVTVSGMLSTDTPVIDVVMTGTFATDETIISSWSSVYRAVTESDAVTFYATDVPTAELSLQLKVVR